MESQSLKKKFASWLGVFLYVYALLVAVDFALYKWGSKLPLPKESQELMTSWGAFDYMQNPQYRSWIKGFVHTPNQPYKYNFWGDIYRVLDVPQPGGQKEIVLPVDEMGFSNRRSVNEAEVLFIGDSFVRSIGCQFDETIPANFERIAGEKVYNASFPGYGLPHYLGIFRHLTVDAPNDNQRFHGKDVYVFIYTGNDLKSNIDDYLWRQADETEWKFPRHLKLYCLRKLVYLGKLKISKLADNPKEMPPNKPAQDSEAKELRRTNGYYPHHIDLPSYKDTPFAFDPYLAQYRRLTWLDDERRKRIDDMIASFRETAQQTNLHVRFVLLPVSLQVLGDRIVKSAGGESLEFDQYLPLATKNYDLLSDFMKERLAAQSFESLDMRPVLKSKIAQEQLYWPGDTHLTPAGNRLVAETLSHAK